MTTKEEMEGFAVEKQHSSTAGNSSYAYWVRGTTGDAAPLPVPRKLSAEDVLKQQAPFALGSVWNQAGTWEEKNLNTWSSGRIKELLTLGWVEFSSGKVDIHEVSKCSGDAFLVTFRNKKRVGYTYEVTLRFRGEWIIREERKMIKGHVNLHEFSFGELDNLQMEVNLTEDKDHSAEDKTCIIKEIKSILPAIREKLLKFEQELKDK